MDPDDMDGIPQPNGDDIETASTADEDIENDGADGGDAGDDVADDGDEDGADEDDEAGKRTRLTPEQQKAFDRRIGKEVRRRKEAEEKLRAREDELNALRERTDGEDSEVVIEAARTAGVMPDVIGKTTARGLQELSRARFWAEKLSDALDDSDGEDSVSIDGQEFDRKEVRAKARAWKREAARLEHRYGDVERKAKSQAMEIWRLGLAAKKAGWKPGQKPNVEVPDPGDAGADGDDEDQPKKKRKPVTDPGSSHAAGEGKSGKEVAVHSIGDLAAWIAQKNKAK